MEDINLTIKLFLVKKNYLKQNSFDLKYTFILKWLYFIK